MLLNCSSKNSSTRHFETALLLSEKNRKVVNGSFTISEYYNSIISNLGVMAQDAKSGRINEELLVSQIDSAREGVKGVSIDEEMITMIQAQRIYQSASRLIVVMDELLEEVVNLL